ncbi:MAG: cupin domain-containing protein [Oscillospiraceae bacterium]
MNDQVELFDFEERQPNIKMPGGRTWVFNSADHLTVKYSEMWDPALVMHSHEAEQINIVLSGKVLFRVGDNVYELRKGSIIRIPPNQPHGLEKKLSDEDFRVIQLVAPKENAVESARVKNMGLEGWPAL